MKVTALQTGEYTPHNEGYLNKVNKDYDLIESFTRSQAMVSAFFKAIPEDKLTYRYAEGKWSILEVFQHLIDTERVFVYRCFRIARRDETALAGFDQDVYITPSLANEKSMTQLLEEYHATRNASISLLKSLTDADLCFIGNANGGPLSARAAAFMIPGHEIWHIDILKERYLV